MLLLVGWQVYQKLFPYVCPQVLKMLGEGGSGETWLCKDIKSGDEFAIKFIVRPIPKVVLPMIFHEVKVRQNCSVCVSWVPAPMQSSGAHMAALFLHFMLTLQIQAALGAGHVNLVQARELFLSKTHLGLAMEFVSGGNLTAYVTDKWDSTGARNGLFLTEDEARYFFKAGA
jgi:serine/threonine-protein kinase SRK2